VFSKQIAAPCQPRCCARPAGALVSRHCRDLGLARRLDAAALHLAMARAFDAAAVHAPVEGNNRARRRKTLMLLMSPVLLPIILVTKVALQALAAQGEDVRLTPMVSDPRGVYACATALVASGNAGKALWRTSPAVCMQ
jgi:hypothetical protein